MRGGLLRLVGWIGDELVGVAEGVALCLAESCRTAGKNVGEYGAVGSFLGWRGGFDFGAIIGFRLALALTWGFAGVSRLVNFFGFDAANVNRIDFIAVETYSPDRAIGLDDFGVVREAFGALDGPAFSRA